MGNGRARKEITGEGTEYSYPVGPKDNRARRQWLTFIYHYLSIEWMTELSIFVSPSLDDSDRAKTRALCLDLAITADAASGEGDETLLGPWGTQL
jgi:hypothetical protein